MGPPIFIGGNLPSKCAERVGDVSFNGAADFHRRKYVHAPWARRPHAALQWGRRFSSAEMTYTDGDPIYAAWLQWGRRFSSAEMVKCAGKIVEDDNASMGPPIFIGGNSNPRSFAHAKWSSLQWGRRFSSAEIR